MDAVRERVPEDQLSFSYARSSGPGGQNVNKVNTRASLLFDLDGTGALTNREKSRIRAMLGTRINKAGYLRVVSMRHRTRRANRRAATDRFYELITYALFRPKARIPTMPSIRVRRRRLQEKRQRSEQKRLRSHGAIDKLDD